MPSIREGISLFLAVLAEKKAEAELALAFARISQKCGLSPHTARIVYREYLDALRSEAKTDCMFGL